jgi:peptidoglycan lytic transglycosylase
MHIFTAFLFCATLSFAHAETASFYGAESGSRTASGERFDAKANTAAMCSLRGCNAPRSEWLPFGTNVRVTYRGRSVVVRINDRGPFGKGRQIDLSTAAARRIGLTAAGVGQVQLEIVAAPYRPKRGDWGFF